MPEDRLPKPLKPWYHTKCWDKLMAAIDNDKMMAAVCHMHSKTAPGPNQMLAPLLKWAVTLVAWHKEQI